MKKLLCLILAAAMVLGTMSTVAFAEETVVAKIGTTDYTDFNDAMTDANATDGTVEVEIYGAVEFTNGMELNGNYDSITFVGKNDDAVITINQSAGGDYLEAHGKTVAFTDLKLAKANPAWSGNSGHMGNYFSVQGGTATYTKCTFPNGACTSGGAATYTGCTFQNTSEYGLWVYDDADVTVKGGTIDSAKGIKVYSEDEASISTTLTVENATFTENITSKPAIAIGYAESITLIGNTYNNTTPVLELDSGSDADCEGVTFVAQDEEGNDIASTLTAIDRQGNKDCGVFVTNPDGTTSIYTSVTTAAEEAESGDTVTLLYNSTEEVKLPGGVTLDTNEYTAPSVYPSLAGEGTDEAPFLINDLKDLLIFADDVNKRNDTYNGKVVKLTADIDLAGVEWTPIGNNVNQFRGYFDGDNHTISNLTVTGNNRYAGFFGYIKGDSMAATATPNVQNLNIVNASVEGDYYVGGLSGQGYTCVVKNVTCSGEVNGVRYVGGLIGHVYTYFEDCHFKGDVTASFDAGGGIAGAGDGRVYYSSVIGTVSGNNWMGGIIGNGQEGTSAVGCYVKATVSSGSNYYYGIGGIAGVGGHGYASSEFKNNYFDGEVYLCGEKVDAIVLGIVNADDNESIKATVSGNSWNTEYYPADTLVFVTAEVASSPSADEWKAAAAEELTQGRNNNLVMLESDLEYVDAINPEDVTIMSFSDVTEEAVEEATQANIVAKIGETPYASLQAAIADAKAGDTVKLLADVEATKEFVIAADDDIILDLNGYTISGNFEESKASKVFDVNGKLTVKDSSADESGRITSHAANPDTQAIPSYASNTIVVGDGTFVLESGTVENLTETGGASYAIDEKWASASSNIIINGGTVKAVVCAIRVIVQRDTVPVNLTINEGAKVIGGRAIWVHLPSSADAKKTANVKVTGGEIIATGRPSGEKSALYVYSFGDSYENVNIELEGGTFTGDILFGGGTANGGSGTETVDISGGVFDGDVHTYNTNVDHKISISGGTFATDVTEYLADGFSIERTADGYGVISSGEKVNADSINVVYKDVTADGTEGEKTYEIVVKADSADEINELASVDLAFDFDADPVTGGAIDFEVLPAKDFTMTKHEDATTYPERYMFNYNGTPAYEGTANAITVGTIKVTGYGEYSIYTSTSDKNVVNATTLKDSLVDSYIVGGAADDSSITGDLVINTHVSNELVGFIDGDVIAVPTRTLTVKVDFPNPVKANKVAYQDMKVEITGNFDGVSQTITYDLGEDGYEMVNGGYVVEEARTVLNEKYTVTVSGAGYRTARYTVSMTEEKELNFWNNVMDDLKVIEVKKDSSAVYTNFLAGDIVKDNNINIYDLSAVVSYFGDELNREEYSKYAKYDLNRDGVIDSKDVAYVLVSWGK